MKNFGSNSIKYIVFRVIVSVLCVYYLVGINRDSFIDFLEKSLIDFLEKNTEVGKIIIFILPIIIIIEVAFELVRCVLIKNKK